MESKAKVARKKRAQKIREQRQEAIRESLKAQEYLRQLETTAKTIQKEWKSMSSEQSSALRLLADINFKRLAKVLPDLKVVEHSGGEKPIEHVLKWKGE